MELYIGGRAQGKLAHAKEKHPDWVIWDAFHLFVREEMEKGAEPSEIWERVCERIDETPNMVIISDEVGNGIVPMDAKERRYREETGRLLCKIAARADGVERITCGIPVKIK
ncbi:MAG: bifunctional adenosylcobinamide kinase/adenosylcobinamide-phosphate guanylyltransferase [Lachnospiraceae bacterium]|nr:bifunctional adenosylcobinamide kinase/adenosylcobinamide-phosphate guanylyltransferase [Lachnospiraceae bacterium]